MIYLISFLFSSLGAYWAGRTKGNLLFLWALFAILFPATLFGLRSSKMGVDVDLYVLPIWNYAQNLHFFDFGGNYGEKIEKGYLLLNYLLAMLFDDFHWILFAVSFISCASVLFALIKSEFKNVAWLGYAYYLLVFFPWSVNLTREAPSNAILFIACMAFLKCKWKNFFIFTLAAILFHNSALVALSFPIIYFTINKIKINYAYVSLIVFLVICIGVGQILFPQYFSIHALLSLALVINAKYSIYLDGSFKPHFTIFSLVFVPFIVVFVVYYKSLKKTYPYLPLVLAMLCISTFLGQLSWMISNYIARVASPYKLFGIIAPMMLLEWVKKKGNNKITFFVQFVLVLYALIYFLLVFFVTDQGGVFPYQSETIDNFTKSIL